MPKIRIYWDTESDPRNPCWVAKTPTGFIKALSSYFYADDDELIFDAEYFLGIWGIELGEIIIER